MSVSIHTREAEIRDTNSRFIEDNGKNDQSKSPKESNPGIERVLGS